jgi:hypothetical protein
VSVELLDVSATANNAAAASTIAMAIPRLSQIRVRDGLRRISSRLGRFVPEGRSPLPVGETSSGYGK